MLQKYDFLQRFEDWEAKCIKQTKQEFQKELIRFKHSFNALCYAFQVILRSKQLQDPQKQAIVLLMPRLIFLSESIHELTLKGYYFEASLLERDMIEGIGLCSLFSRDRDEASKWARGERVRIPKRQIAHETAVFFKSASDNRVKKLYDSLSGLVHLDAKAVISFLPYKTEKSLGLQILPIFDKEKATSFSIYPLLLSSILWFVFEDELGKELREEMQDFFFEVAEEMRKEV